MLRYLVKSKLLIVFRCLVQQNRSVGGFCLEFKGETDDYHYQSVR